MILQPSLLQVAISASILLATTSSVAAFDPSCGDGYTGYSLKLGTKCRDYVYCSAGLILSSTTCPGDTVYSGNVGVGGVCTFSGPNVCAEDSASFTATTTTTTTAATSASSSSSGESNTISINVDSSGANTLAQLLQGSTATEPAPSPPSAGTFVQSFPSPPTVTATTSTGGGYCGESKIDAESKCIPCVNNMCSDFTHACWTYATCNSSNSQPSPPTTTATYTEPAPSPSASFTVSSPTITYPVLGTTTYEEKESIPSQSQTLPPWTNAPFTPYSGPRVDKTVIGYYASWQWYDRTKFADPQNINWSKYDRINYAFFQIDEQGDIYGTDEWADPQLLWGPYIYDTAQQIQSGPGANYKCSWDGPQLRNCNYHDLSKGIVELAHRAGATVMPSIGGWTLSDNFPGVAADPLKRQNFAKNCVRLVNDYNFDGIDIDWEYPGYEDHSGTPNDKYTYTLFLAEIRKQLDELGRIKGKYYKLTAALPCGPDKIENIQVDQIKDILDELNLMSYDLHGSWDLLTGTNAPMFDQGWTDTTKRWSVHGCTNTYVEYGVPLSKINLGLPFYGRSFRTATGMKQFHEGADDINFHLDEGSPQYFNIVNELKRMSTYRHEKTQTQYAVFNDANGGVVSYDDPRAICDKVHYANQRGMNGFLVWEISGDMLDNGETPLIDATNAKIADPNLDCSKLRDPLWSLSSPTYLYAPDEPETVDWSQAASYTIQSSGSGNDFNGAQTADVSRPASTSTSDNDYSTAQNQVYTSTDTYSSSSTSETTFVELAPPIAEESECPPSYTGYWTNKGCTEYFTCENGSILGAPQPCVPGTLFSITELTCDFAANVSC